MLASIVGQSWEGKPHFSRSLWHVAAQFDGAKGFATLRLPRTIDHHGNGAVDAIGNQTEHQTDVLLASSLGEVEVFIAHDRTIGIVYHEIVVVLQVVRFVEVRFCAVAHLNVRAEERVVRPDMDGRLRTCEPAGDASRMAFQGIETLEGKAFRVVLAFRDLHLATSTFLYLYLDGSHHSLTGILVGTRLTMIEHIPLTIDLADRAVGVTIGHSRGDHLALFVLLAGTSVDDSAAISPWTKGLVAIGIGQIVV